MSVDYCFLTEAASAQDTEHVKSISTETSMTVLVMLWTACRSILAYFVQSK